MSLLRMIYLALAVVGTSFPVWRIVSEPGHAIRAIPWDRAGWSAFADQYLVTVHWDWVVVALTLTVWILAEVAVRRNWSALWAVPATWVIGPSSGLPLYLFLRSRPVT